MITRPEEHYLQHNNADEQTIRVGVVAPLTRPGWIGAGRHLLAGLELGVKELNEHGTLSKRVELLIEDTAADPRRAFATVDFFSQEGVAAIVGEYHSVVARAVATRAHQLGLPFLCTSAVLDKLTDDPSDWVARLSPPQSRGWGVYADFLAAQGHRSVAVVCTPSVYWDAGVCILRNHLEAVGGDIVEIDVSGLSPAELCERLAASAATALLLLVGAPEPFVSIVQQIRQDPRHSDMFIGAPAGQPELTEVNSLLGNLGAAIPFLQYLPDQFSEAGSRVVQRLRESLGETPSFIALEGYDAARVTGELLKLIDGDFAVDTVWRDIAVEGSRGLISFSRVPGISVWQWDEAPIQIADRDPAKPSTIRIRRPHVLIASSR